MHTFQLRALTFFVYLATLIVSRPLFAQTGSASQLIIENPKHLDISEARARAIFTMARRVLAEDLHIPVAPDENFALRLVLGAEVERYTEDEQNNIPTIYLSQWNDGKFALSALRLAVWRVLDKKHQLRMLNEIVRRADEVTPTSVTVLRTFKPAMPPPLSLEADCMSASHNVICDNFTNGPSSRIATPYPPRGR